MQQFQVDEVERFDGVSLLDHAGDAGRRRNCQPESLDKVGREARDSLDLACALGNHLDVDVALRERAEGHPV